MRATLLAAVLAGCWTSATSQPVAPAPDPVPVATARVHVAKKSPCELAIDHIIEVYGDELAAIADFSDKLAAMRDTAVVSCTELHWAPELLDCLGGAKDNSLLGQCQSLMTPEQMSDLMKRITEVVTQPATP